MEKTTVREDNELIAHGGNLTLTFKGEQYSGLKILDTKVEIESGTLCWITWDDKEKFMQELNELIDRYAI